MCLLCRAGVQCAPARCKRHMHSLAQSFLEQHVPACLSGAVHYLGSTLSAASSPRPLLCPWGGSMTSSDCGGWVFALRPPFGSRQAGRQAGRGAYKLPASLCSFSLTDVSLCRPCTGWRVFAGPPQHAAAGGGSPPGDLARAECAGAQLHHLACALPLLHVCPHIGPSRGVPA